MTLLPYAVLLYIPLVCASLPSLNGTTFDAANDCPSYHARNLWRIIWSCVATLFACTWTGIHPNIPGMKEGKFAVVSRRAFIMIMALIAPELIVTLAAAQFFSARAAAKDFNREFCSQSPNAHIPANCRKWTTTDGFFAWMGGYILYVDNQPRATLTPDELRRFVREESVHMPVVEEADIEDKSKNDLLSKGVTFLQLVWFILQLVARRVQNLPITLLEIDTLAVTALICFSYLLWLKKPKNVERPYIVHWKKTEAIPLPPSEADSRLSKGCCFPAIFYLIYPLWSSMGISTITSHRAAHSRRVPSLGGYGDVSGAINSIKAAVGVCSMMVFGGIHFLGCNFSILTDSDPNPDQQSWFFDSMVVTSAPLSLFFLLLLILLIKPASDAPPPNWSSRIIYYLAMIEVLIFIVIYIPARVALAVLIIRNLLSVPAGVHYAVDWTKFIPHW
ncbi:hypothetical protein DFH29DRAFT_1072420 [Suillus ampliporus]|nr:hypothetical protein DFH29DRAFT_1072420 [Suillus ampliporus]